MTPLVSIVVANWNGQEWIARCLSSLQISARHAGLPFELIVVDDASTDGSADLLRARFPAVRLLVNPRNLGFARTVNRGARQARGRVLVLANNDLLVREAFVAELAKWFLQPSLARPFAGKRRLFAVSAKTVGWYDGKPNQLCMGAVWRGGRITPAWDDPKGAAPCLFAQAGAAAYDREAWTQLGGLATFYEPGYWEDYDLSWRAARAGFAQLYDPAAFALHVGGGSMTRRYGAPGVALMKGRNHLLFEAANLRSPRLLAEWSARLPLGLARSLHSTPVPGAASLDAAARAALPRLPQALAHRLRGPQAQHSDLDLLRPFREFTPSF